MSYIFHLHIPFLYKISYYATKDRSEFFSECFVMYERNKEKLPKYIIDMINEYLIQGNDLTSGLEKLINLIIEQGRIIPFSNLT